MNFGTSVIVTCLDVTVRTFKILWLSSQLFNVRLWDENCLFFFLYTFLSTVSKHRKTPSVALFLSSSLSQYLSLAQIQFNYHT